MLRLGVITRLGVLTSIMFAGILLTAQDVKKDYDHSFDFSQLHTFAVKIGTSWGNPLSENRVKTTVANELVKHGWVQAADDGSADALVVIHGATQNKQSLNTFYSGGGWGGYGWGGWGGMPSTATTTVSDYRVGTMVVDIFDAKNKKLVFRGTGEDELSDKPEKNEKKVAKATEKMFKDFPPQPKSDK
jgi:hypothetical protein